jgi:catechol 2,3-dioxygenase-like lactoylglutathione lyase family enzyme
MRPDGAWQIYVRDPDGHVIELFTPPPETMDDR